MEDEELERLKKEELERNRPEWEQTKWLIKRLLEVSVIALLLVFVFEVLGL